MPSLRDIEIIRPISFLPDDDLARQVLIPSRPLIDQWHEEVEPLGVRPVNLADGPNCARRHRFVSKVHRRLRHGRSNLEVLVVTRETLCDPAFIERFGAGDTPRPLIADEMYNLGGESFLADPPKIFQYRLGLSGTPVRQYDPDGIGGSDKSPSTSRASGVAEP